MIIFMDRCLSLPQKMVIILGGHYDVQLICTNGHQINANYYYATNLIGIRFPPRCGKCGAELIKECPECKKEIKGRFVLDQRNVQQGSIAVPNHCEYCGKPLPWAGKTEQIKGVVPQSFWDIVHPSICDEARTRFESGHYADAVETSMKIVNSRVKEIVREKKGEEFDGKKLMTLAFSVNNPIINLSNTSTLTGKDIQEGYMHLFCGAIQAIRNPKAHGIEIVDSNKAMHMIFLASLLMIELDEGERFSLNAQGIGN